MRAHPSGPLARTWVDDLTAVARTEQAAVGTVAIGVASARELVSVGLVIDRKKSGPLASSSAFGDQLLVLTAGMAERKQPISDLGVVQGAGPEARCARGGRWDTMVERLGRLAKLAGRYGTQALMVAASATAAGAHGAGQRVLGKADLQGVRRWLKFALYKGTRRAAYELLLWVTDVPWRIDPGLQATLRAAHAVQQALRLGVVTRGEVELLWGHQDNDNAVAGLRGCSSQALTVAWAAGGTKAAAG